MNKEQIVKVIVEVVENQVRDSAPENIPQEELEAIITLNRSGLTSTATKIADRLIEDNIVG